MAAPHPIVALADRAPGARYEDLPPQVAATRIVVRTSTYTMLLAGLNERGEPT